VYKDIAPIPIPHRPWALNGISKDMMVSHYENNYGGAVRTLNAVRRELAGLEGGAPGYRVRALKREELSALNSVALHELYFGNLGGDGRVTEPVRAMLEEHFGSHAAWRKEFVAASLSLAGGSGWALLTYSRRQKALWIQTAGDHTQGAVDATPVLALDMYEHAYHMDFGANASAYVDAIMRNLDWAAVAERIDAVRADRPRPPEDPSDKSLPSISVEELATQLAKGETVQLLDARPRHYISRASDIMAGATWRDPERVDEWIGELKPDEPVAVYCAYGFHVGCGVTKVLRERGLDARYVRGGLSAWYAAGGARAARLPGEGT
jgi:Fe-Mn family superoxide dismutase